jgi:hypothetical protein
MVPEPAAFVQRLNTDSGRQSQLLHSADVALIAKNPWGQVSAVGQIHK